MPVFSWREEAPGCSVSIFRSEASLGNYFSKRNPARAKGLSHSKGLALLTVTCCLQRTEPDETVLRHQVSRVLKGPSETSVPTGAVPTGAVFARRRPGRSLSSAGSRVPGPLSSGDACACEVQTAECRQIRDGGRPSSPVSPSLFQSPGGCERGRRGTPRWARVPPCRRLCLAGPQRTLETSPGRHV